jgi:phenylalanyl-tRNA synthetase alpha chain
MSQRPISELLVGLDKEFESLKQNPASVTISSSSANNEIRNYVSSIASRADLDDARIKLLGKNGKLTQYRSEIGKQPPEKRREIAAQINPLSAEYESLLESRDHVLKEEELEQRLNTESIDVTLPVREAPFELGRVHPITQVTDELTAIFADMGFAVAEGPDIETEDYNFTKLNFPEEHPARDMLDTFFFNPKPDGSRLLLRTHSSPVQVRTMLSQKPPIRVIIPGRT